MFTEILKWVATTIAVLGSLINAMGYQPEGPIILIVGSILWLWVGVRWKEMTMIITNFAIITVTIVGMLILKGLPV